MQDVLVGLQNNLASRIAIRYACQFEKTVRFNMQVIHIPAQDEKEHPTHGGWVKQTWESTVARQSRDWLSELIRKELVYHHSTGEPKIKLGDRDQVILDELQQRSYGFFMEGLLHAFEPELFMQKIDSRLYRNAPCPVLMVKNLVTLDRGLRIVATPETVSSVLSWFSRVLQEFPIDPDMVICHFEPQGKDFRIIENDQALVTGLEARMLGHGKRLGTVTTLKGPSREMASRLQDHGLVIAPLPEGRSDMAALLAMSPCPILFCPATGTD
ncbi:MAG: hypothetical protein V1793_19730 [Pseudomonadota bacterium]